MRYPRNILVLMMTLVAFPTSGLLCQRGVDLQAGLTPASAQVSGHSTQVAAAIQSKDVEWVNGAAIGGLIGAGLGYAMTRGNTGGALILGVLGAVFGAMMQALFS
ncbi:MAG: hypothetical protein ABIR59_12270 [Gemmatimonadales bacterium]